MRGTDNNPCGFRQQFSAAANFTFTRHILIETYLFKVDCETSYPNLY